MTTVAEALEVLESAATTRRARTTLDALKDAIEHADRGRQADKSSSEEPKFPDANSVALLDKEGDNESAKGTPQPETAKGTATARKGS